MLKVGHFINVPRWIAAVDVISSSGLTSKQQKHNLLGEVIHILVLNEDRQLQTITPGKTFIHHQATPLVVLVVKMMMIL